MSCAAVTITTDAPPMNEHVTPDAGVLVSYSRSEPRHLGTNYYVDGDALQNALQTATAVSPEQKETMGLRAREAFLASEMAFAQAVAAALSSV
jgi:hypothetical protein